NYGKIETNCIGTDLSMNVEELAKQGVQAAVIWDYQEDEAKQLTKLGITPIMIKNGTVKELQASFKAIGELLGKEKRAQQFINSYSETYKELQSFSDKIDKAAKPKVLYLRNPKLELQGNDNFIKEAMNLAGANNTTANLSNITMEEIFKINPDIILLSNFDAFIPEDLYENRIDGQDWSNVAAVKNHRVYKTPIGIYRWDAPGVETPLMMKWMAQLFQPEIFSNIDINKELKDYFKTYFSYDVSDDEVSQILNNSANTNSK
ncbi:MAG: ABC transporter substrate-binding protein, partial [Clostridiales bacterium]